MKKVMIISVFLGIAMTLILAPTLSAKIGSCGPDVLQELTECSASGGRIMNFSCETQGAICGGTPALHGFCFRCVY